MDNFKEQYGFTKEEWENCLKVLAVLKNSPYQNPDNQVFASLLTKVAKKAKKTVKREKRQETINTAKQSTLARNALEGTSYFGNEERDSTPHYTHVHPPAKCYICQTAYNQVHSFYHRLCPECAELNWQQRWLDVNLSGRRAIVTGGRVKVGYALALKLLRSGADVTVTTRFPALAYEQYQKESDFQVWQNRLRVVGLDLRILTDVEEFIKQYQRQHDSLDILVNNAAQTIRYNQAYYEPLLATEQKLLSKYADKPMLPLSPNPRLAPNTKTLGELTSLSDVRLTRFGQPVDTRDKNSWNSKLADIELPELLEVNLINQLSPFLLIKAFTEHFKQSSFKDKFIINVTSSEGQFSYTNKTKFHPHTNMTKAALNMLTHTSAKEYAEHGIYMNAVDVGWISTGAQESLRAQQFEAGYIPPLDSVDGAARILHPIAAKLHGIQAFIGKLLKNYKEEQW